MDYVSRFPSLYKSLHSNNHYGLAPEIMVMDGGMGTALFNAGVGKSSVVWSAISLIKPEYHNTVIKCHEDYIRAGAHMLTTNNYAVQPFYYMEYYGPEKYQKKLEEHTVLAAQLTRLAVQNCKKRGELNGTIKIAGCIPPCRESLRPDLTNAWLEEPKNWDIALNYYKTISTMLEPFVDCFLLETVNSLLELRCMLEAMQHVRKPLMISMQGGFLDPKTMLPNPTKAEEAAQFVLKVASQGTFKIDMFSLNCAHPDHIEEALMSLSDMTKHGLKKRGIKLGAYANSVVKEAWDPKNAYSGEAIRVRDANIKSNYVRYAMRWNALGVECIGGCCGVAKEEIRNVADYFNCPPVLSSNGRNVTEGWVASSPLRVMKTSRKTRMENNRTRKNFRLSRL